MGSLNLDLPNKYYRRIATITGTCFVKRLWRPFDLTYNKNWQQLFTTSNWQSNFSI